MKNKGVYEVLEKLGMSKEEIDNAFEVNKNLERVIGADIIQMIDFFKTYNLSEKNIIEIENKNPYFLTESFVRIRFLEEDYNRIGIDDFKELLLKHPYAMSINPKSLHDFIENSTYSKDEIKKIIYENFEEIFEC